MELPSINPLYGPDTGYRYRFQFHNGGLAARKTNDIVDVAQCPVATAEINGWLSTVPRQERPRGRIQVFGGSRVLQDTTQTARFPHVIVAQEQPKTTAEKTPGLKTVSGKTNRYFSGTTLNPANLAAVSLAGKTIRFDVQGFFQSNMDILEQAVGRICSGIGGRNALDMYCGAGTFSVFLADLFEKVTLVEHNRDALVFAEINMAGKKHDSYGISGEKWVRENADGILNRNGPFDAVVIDPPRSGMERDVCRWLCETRPAHIRSISCDPSTHARDAARLVRAGYRIEELYLLDFYPETSHIESLACFEYSR